MNMNHNQKNKYYVCLPGSDQTLVTIEESIAAGNEFILDYNFNYFKKIFDHIEQISNKAGLTFYITRDVQVLPSYGSDVVAILLGDEWCRIPRYFDKVKAVFKCYGTKPVTGYHPFNQPILLSTMTLIQFIRLLLIRLPGILRHLLYTVKNSRGQNFRLAPIHEIPLGFYKQEDLPIKDFLSRDYDIFFRGSMINHKKSQSYFPRFSLKSPKNLSRNRMIENLMLLKNKHPDINIELFLIDKFLHGQSKITSDSYSLDMMNTKICLVPRGTSFETFRLFEGLRYGCIVITETLPKHWFYEGSPAIQIKDWSQLDDILIELISSKEMMLERHQAALSWWNLKCSETAVGDYMASKLDILMPSSLQT
jgi:hypothetical protein